MRNALGAACVVGLLLAPSMAQAQDCSSLPNPLYVPGTTDVKPLLSRLAPKLALPGAEQQTVVYLPQGSCTAADLVLRNADLTGTATYWTGNLTDAGAPEEKSCTVAAGTKPDLALSDVTLQTCTGAEPPSGFGQFPSVVQTFGFVVPTTSSQTAITAEEAYFLFKFGAESGKQVPPWTDPASIHIRSPAASTQLLIGLASGIPGTRWSANLTSAQSGAGAMVTTVAAQNGTDAAGKTIGILSSQRFDENRDKLKMLAFQAFKQGCLGAVLPDSTKTATDKRNVRDGHYEIWGYLWGIAPTASGVASKASTKTFIELLAGTPRAGIDPLEAAARAGAVPNCAMEVKRSQDGAPLEGFTPATPCSCRYEQLATGTTSCTACSTATPCATGTCRAGFCEAR